MNFDSPPLPSRDRVVLAGYIVVVVVVLALTLDWKMQQNFDNAVRIWLLIQPWSVLFYNISLIELAPPLWHIVGKSALTVSPLPDILTLRLLNCLLFVSMVPLGFRAGQLLGGRSAAWGVALILPWSTFLLEFIPSTNHYMLYATLAVAYTVALAALLRAPTRRLAVMFAVITAAFGFTHYYALAYIGGTAVISMLLHGWRYDLGQILHGTWDDLRRGRVETYHWFGSPSVLPLILPFMPVVLLYLVWSPIFFDQYVNYASSYSTAYSSAGGFVTTAIRFIGRQLPAFGPLHLPISSGLLTALVVSVPLGGAGLWRVVRSRDRVQVVIVGGAFVGATTLILSGKYYNPRHGLWIAAIAPILLGLGARTVVGTLRERVPGYNSTTVVASIVVLVAVSAGPAIATIDETTARETNVDRPADIVRTSYTANSVILSSSPWGEYVLQAHGVEAPVYGIPEEAVDGDRALPVREDYDPETHPEDFARVQQLVEGKERVIVLNAHGMVKDRLPPLLQDLDQLGFTVVRSYEKGTNGVVILERD